MEKAGWILYDDADYELNKAFAAHMIQEAAKRAISVKLVLLSQLHFVMDAGRLACLVSGRPVQPDFVISRQRDPLISATLEQAGIRVYNNARVCEICNDKRKTHLFLHGLPMLQTTFSAGGRSAPPEPEHFPLIVKPVFGHGGDRIFWTKTQAEWQSAASRIFPEPFLQQKIASDFGRDLRVYVLAGKIVASVMRTAKEGFISNYKKGGDVALHTLTKRENALAMQVIKRFALAGAPLCFAGIDFLYDQGEPVVSEVEDVVGSRMLYHVSNIDIAGLFLDSLAQGGFDGSY